MNHLLSGSSTAPAVGGGATILGWTDRHPGTVVSVSPSGKTAVVREDRAVRVDGNGMSDCQEYRYESDPQGCTWTARLTKRGWRAAGAGVVFGRREKYHDFSF